MQAERRKPAAHGPHAVQVGCRRARTAAAARFACVRTRTRTGTGAKREEGRGLAVRAVRQVGRWREGASQSRRVRGAGAGAQAKQTLCASKQRTFVSRDSVKIAESGSMPSHGPEHEATESGWVGGRVESGCAGETGTRRAPAAQESRRATEAVADSPMPLGRVRACHSRQCFFFCKATREVFPTRQE